MVPSRVQVMDIITGQDVYFGPATEVKVLFKEGKRGGTLADVTVVRIGFRVYMASGLLLLFWP